MQRKFCQNAGQRRRPLEASRRRGAVRRGGERLAAGFAHAELAVLDVRIMERIREQEHRLTSSQSR